MNDADYIESQARYSDEKEIFYRSMGMFELAEWYQWAAGSTRLRQPTHCTRGSGGYSIAVYLSDGWLYALGDMTPDQARKAGEYLVDQATRKIDQDSLYVLQSVTQASSALAAQVQALLAALKPPAEADGPR